MSAYISPVDGHEHYNEQAKAVCAVCALVAERDRLRAALMLIRDRPNNQADLYAAIALDPSQIAPLREAGVVVPEALDVSPSMGDED